MKRPLKRQQLTDQDVDSEGSWAISYGDMITLLLSFFVIYFTMDPQAHIEQELEKSLLSALQPLQTSTNNAAKQPASQVLKPIDPQIKNLVDAEIHRVQDKMIVDFREVSFYNSAQIQLTPSGQKALKDFANLYLPFAGQYRLGIKAYTDPRPVKHSKYVRFKDNLELSALRAVAAMRVLQDSGIPLRRMHLSGQGEFEPIHHHLTKGLSKQEKLALSRKVVLVIDRQVQISSNNFSKKEEETL